LCVFKDNSHRLRGWDYTDPGYYFITINTDADICWFGKIENKKVILSELGEIANQYWKEMPKHHKNVQLDKYIIMPDHVHGIVIIKGEGIYKLVNTCGALYRDIVRYNCNKNNTLPLVNKDLSYRMSRISPKPDSLSTIIRSYKSAVSKTAHESGYKEFKWQSRYYDQIIKTNEQLFAIQKYIINNPKKR